MGDGQLTPPSIKLRVSDERDWYVQGDLIRGEVLVAIDDAAYHVHSLQVRLFLDEEAEFDPYHRRGTKEACASSELISSVRLLRGYYTFAYTLDITYEAVFGFPPSFDVGEKGLSCGIKCYVKWSVEAELTYGQQRNKVGDIALLKVFPLPTEADFLLLDKCGRLYTYTGKYFKATASYPHKLPQSPNICDINIQIYFDAPTFVRSVEVCLVRLLVMWVGSESKAHKDNEVLETVQIESTIDKLELNGVSRQWRIRGPRPSMFCTQTVFMRYCLCLRVRFVDNSDDVLFKNVDLAPAALVQAVPKSVAAGGAVKEIYGPPPYSKS